MKAMKLQGYLRNKFYRAHENLRNYELLNCMIRNHKSLEIDMVNILVFLLPCYLIFIFLRVEVSFQELMVALFIQSLESLAIRVRRINQIIYWVEDEIRSFEMCMWFKFVDPEENLKSFDRDFQIYTEVNRQTLDQIEDNFGKVDEDGLVSKGVLEMKNVSTKYSIHNKLVLKNLSFRIGAGEKIGVVGRTGSGKSSLIKLLWRYLEPVEGSILVDGVDISKADLKSYRSKINVVTQDTSLIYGSLREDLDPFNLLNVDDESLINYLKDLGFTNKEFLEKGLDMKIEGNGTNLSMGERQVIALARVLLNPKRLVILDEATSSMDIKTEQFVQKEIENKLKDSTMLVIAHRLQTVIKCDRILVLEQGKIAVVDLVDNLLKNLEKLNNGEKVEGVEGVRFFGKAIEEISKNN